MSESYRPVTTEEARMDAKVSDVVVLICHMASRLRNDPSWDSISDEGIVAQCYGLLDAAKKMEAARVEAYISKETKRRRGR